jgi:N-acetylglucosaminyl-diphospho-decaprenol L-rhamnosyltransferase
VDETGVIGAVVVDHHAGAQLEGCVRSLLDDGAGIVVVVENGAPDSADAALAGLLAVPPAAPVRIVRPGSNLGYGAGVNRGLAALAGEPSPPEWVLVSNPDLVIHHGALESLRAALEAQPAWAIAGPRIFTEAGEVYPSVRTFPSFADATGHALFGLFNPENRFSRRYNPGAPSGDVVTPADWVSGSCFMARRSALEELGGFDESYYMYLEDTDLCWRAHQAGWGVGFAGTAAVTHVQGVSTARHPYRMMAAHHRSALRFTIRTTKGWRRAALPLAALVLGARMAIATVRLAVTH